MPATETAVRCGVLPFASITEAKAWAEAVGARSPVLVAVDGFSYPFLLAKILASGNGWTVQDYRAVSWRTTKVCHRGCAGAGKPVSGWEGSHEAIAV